jgi:hypothetical protein
MERTGPDSESLHGTYRVLLGLSIFRGYRRGLPRVWLTHGRNHWAQVARGPARPSAEPAREFGWPEATLAVFLVFLFVGGLVFFNRLTWLTGKLTFLNRFNL